MARYDVYLEISGAGAVLAHVPDLLGCHFFASTAKEALDGLNGHIAVDRAWRRTMHLPVPPERGARSLNLVEEAFGNGPWSPSGADAFFSWDAQPLTRTQLDEAIEVLTATGRSLSALVDGTHPLVMRWRPQPQARSVLRTLSHLESCARWYLSRLGIELQRSARTVGLDELAATRSAVLDALQTTSERMRSVTLEPRRGAGNAIEKWTARKVVRRLAEHDLEHIGVIRNIIRLYSESGLPHRQNRPGL